METSICRKASVWVRALLKLLAISYSGNVFFFVERVQSMGCSQRGEMSLQPEFWLPTSCSPMSTSSTVPPISRSFSATFSIIRCSSGLLWMLLESLSIATQSLRACNTSGRTVVSLGHSSCYYEICEKINIYASESQNHSEQHLQPFFFISGYIFYLILMSLNLSYCFTKYGTSVVI